MPRHPHVSSTTETLSSRVFSELAAKAARLRREGRRLYDLSVGDTYREPLMAARAEAQTTAEHPHLHTYAPPRGVPELLDAVSERLSSLGGEVPPERIQIMSGATSGLSVVCETILDPGDEVLLPAPFWPLIRGIIASRGATAVQIPFYDRLERIDVREVLEAAITERTVALYVNTPHNPTGRVLSPAVVDAMVEVARAHDLWLITDEAYQDLCFAERPRPIWARPEVQDRVIACHTLSKSYGLAGARVGYTHGPEAVMKAIRGVQTFSTYCAPKPMQLGAARALKEGDAWVEQARSAYAEAGRLAAEALGIDAPQGGTFLFFDATPYLRDGEDDAMGLLDRCLDRGVLLTPGVSCGVDYARWVRLCFTSVPRPELEAALEALGPVLS